MCQFLPGPASSQVGIAIGLKRAGPLGALAAWLGFTLPSALLMVGFARHFVGADELLHAPWVHGLLIAAVAVVAQAVWSMGRQFCAARMALAIALVAAFMCTLAGNGLTQLLVLAAAAAAGWWLLPGTDDSRPPSPGHATDAGRRGARYCRQLASPRHRGAAAVCSAADRTCRLRPQ